MFSLSLLVLLAAAPSPAERWITADSLRAHVRYLASDLLEGRGPGTRGGQLAQAYVQAELESLGLQGAAPGGGFFQPFEMVGVRGHPTTAEVRGKSGALTLSSGPQLIATAGRPEAKSRIEDAEIVFVGYGITAPEYQWDDFKGVDLRGKVLLMMNNDPESDPQLFAGTTRLYYGRWDYKYASAARQGAVGAIIIHTNHSAGYPWQVVQTSWSGEQFMLPDEPGPTLTLRSWVTDDAAHALVKLAGQDLDALRAAAERRDFKPVPLGVSFSASFDNEVRRATSANVLAMLPGSDRDLAQEVVMFSAHTDHLGTKPAAKPGEDGIYNGALDNASGVAELLTLARAYAALPKAPRRSILFAAVAAEEQGLLGSRYLAHHLPVPAGKIAVDINMDGANIWGRTHDVTVIGLGKTSLDPTLARLAAAQGRHLEPDPFPDHGSFYRSDQFSFAQVGIPAAYFESGVDYVGRPAGWGRETREAWVQTHYHQPSDELNDAWDFTGAIEDVQLYFRLGREIADAPAMPAWTKGDEFEAIRLHALEDAQNAPKR
jgi:Zn-dependent M28 family amino/carboxypeptidase